MKINGFTLAEILITLAIIGVVATLTIPGTIKNYRNKVLTTQLQNTVNIVKTAIADAMDDTAAESFSDIASSPGAIGEFMTKYFDHVASCGGNVDDHNASYANCLAESYSSFDKTATYNARAGFYDIGIIAGGEGTCVTIPAGASICASMYGEEKAIVDTVFMIDINGLEGPNVNGKDLFAFGVDPAGKMQFVLHSDDDRQAMTNGTNCTTSSANPFTSGCLAYVVSHSWTFKY